MLLKGSDDPVSCLIVFSSLTHAQRAAQIFRRNGITVELKKPPALPERGSCAYGLVIDPRILPAVRELLQKTALVVVGIYNIASDGKLYRANHVNISTVK